MPLAFTQEDFLVSGVFTLGVTGTELEKDKMGTEPAGCVLESLSTM